MYPFLSIGPFLLQLPGLALLIGMWIGVTLAEGEAKKLRLNPSELYNLVFFGVAAGFIGARLAYAGRYFSTYLQDPLGFFSLNPNTLNPFGGLLIGFAAAIFYGRRKKLPLRPTLDAFTPGLAVFMVLFAVAHYLSGNAFGAPSDLPWAIYLWDDYRHPTQVYEFLLALGIFYLAWRRPLAKPGSGVNFLALVGLSAAARLFLEAFRGDSPLMPAGLRAAQMVSLGVIGACLWLIKIWAPQDEISQKGSS